MSERDRIDPNEGLRPPLPPAAQAGLREEARKRARENDLDVAAVIFQALVAIGAGGAAGAYVAPGTGAIVGMVGLFAGLAAGWALSNFFLLLFAPFALAKTLPRVVARDPASLPKPDPNEGRVLWRLTIAACNAVLYLAGWSCAAMLAWLHEGTRFWPAMLAFTLAAFVTALFTRRARNVVI